MLARCKPVGDDVDVGVDVVDDGVGGTTEVLVVIHNTINAPRTVTSNGNTNLFRAWGNRFFNFCNQVSGGGGGRGGGGSVGGVVVVGSS